MQNPEARMYSFSLFFNQFYTRSDQLLYALKNTKYRFEIIIFAVGLKKALLFNCK